METWIISQGGHPAIGPAQGNECSLEMSRLVTRLDPTESHINRVAMNIFICLA
jgi:hypothetical protein